MIRLLSFDSLETATDFEQLFNILVQFKDYRGNHPVITANTVVCNPDFKKIRSSNFSAYFFESFLETYSNYPNCENSLDYLLRE
jgi:hypothetical protein